MALEFHEHVARSENIFELHEARFGFAVGIALERAHERTFLVARQRDEAVGEFRQLIPAHFAFAFGRAEMRAE